MRSRSSWNGLRSPQGSSSASRPRVAYERTASGDRRLASSASRRARKASATGPVVRIGPGDSTRTYRRARDGHCRRFQDSPGNAHAVSRDGLR